MVFLCGFATCVSFGVQIFCLLNFFSYWWVLYIFWIQVFVRCVLCFSLMLWFVFAFSLSLLKILFIYSR